MGDSVRGPNERMLEWIGPKVEGSEQFADRGIGGQPCWAPGCALWAVDLNNDGQMEVLQLPKQKWSGPVYFFTRDAQGQWKRAGTYEESDNSPELIEAIRQGKVKVVKPRKFDDVQAVGVQIERVAPEPESAPRSAAVLHLIGSGMVPPRGR